jgi:arylsulfatase
LGKGGTGVLAVDGKEVAKKSMEHTIPVTFPEDETLDIGQDTRTGVAMVEYRYEVPFKFTGKINKADLQPRAKAVDRYAAGAGSQSDPQTEKQGHETHKRSISFPTAQSYMSKKAFGLIRSSQ